MAPMTLRTTLRAALLLLLLPLTACVRGEPTAPPAPPTPTPAAVVAPALTVEVWTDLICPWCYVGKRRLEAALARFPHREQVQVRWRAFELDPESPIELPMPLTQKLSEKYGVPRERAEQMQSDVTAIAAQEGLTYRLAQARTGNTRPGHRLVHLAAATGRAGAMEERLMRAYFTEGVAIGRAEALLPLALEVGLPEAEAQAALAGGPLDAEVTADEQEAQRRGLRGVPAFVFPNGEVLSGAKPVEAFSQALERAWAARPTTAP